MSSSKAKHGDDAVSLPNQKSLADSQKACASQTSSWQFCEKTVTFLG